MGNILNKALLGVISLGCGSLHSETYAGLPANGFTFADLKNIILENHLNSVNETLAYFAQDPRYSRLVENPVLNPRSFALHGSDVVPRFPRIVLHDRNFVLQVTGDPSKVSSEIIESFEFNPEDQRLHFQIINFPARATNEMFVEDAESADFQHMKHPSYGTIVACSGCHGLEAPDSRPRWGAGPFWQTPFGGIDETIFAASPAARDWDTFQNTLKDSSDGKRYRLLKLSRTQTLANGDQLLLDHPNSALTATLDQMNLRRIAHLVTSSDFYPPLQYAVAAAFLGCDELESFIPPAVLTGLETSATTFLEKSPIAGLYPLASLDSIQLELFVAKFPERQPQPNQRLIRLTEGQFQELSLSASVSSRLLAGVHATNLQYLSTLLGRPVEGPIALAPIDLSRSIFEDIELGNLTDDLLFMNLAATAGQTQDEGLMAQLRLLLEPSLSERVSDWSAAVAFPFAVSYLFPASEGAASALFTQELAPRLLAEHPALDSFGGKPAVARNLQKPLSNYCDTLRTLSLASLSQF
jgi:hypothetical protein